MCGIDKCLGTLVLSELVIIRQTLSASSMIITHTREHSYTYSQLETLKKHAACMAINHHTHAHSPSSGNTIDNNVQIPCNGSYNGSYC